MARDESLFSDGELRLALEAQLQEMRKAVEAEPEEVLKQADVAEWAAALAHHFAVACPELQTEGIWREDVEDAKVDVSWNQLRDFSDPDLARNFPGYRVVVHVPFHGDPAVFKLRPDAYKLNWPRGRVEEADLLLTIEWARDEQPSIDAKVDFFVQTINEWLGFAGTQIESFNDRLEAEARRAIDERRHRIEQRDEHLAESKIPVGRPRDSKTRIADVLVRRPAPALPEARADNQAPSLEPVLEESVFEHILRVIRRHAREMEKSPGAYAGMGEEARRWVAGCTRT